jgi:hypothetical protein
MIVLAQGPHTPPLALKPKFLILSDASNRSDYPSVNRNQTVIVLPAMTPKPRHILASVILAAAAVSCGQSVEYVPDNHPKFFVDADGTNESAVRDTLRNRYPHLKLDDGRITLNNRCPVRKVGLNRRLPVLFVNSRPIGFC